ncbi:M1 family metallopeptidase [Sporosarcina aquimarina]|uniref:M1 family metallopeptidase n=1 Tax=Sporosarcina aquimarina TaxID=114975 RepID=UPI00203AC334|nr:M1 family metallopeptidase [Sporosarcina aquimarina]MCM3758163.1 M1 family metallopeptidase [Sporosarcina aquimarina]
MVFVFLKPAPRNVDKEIVLVEKNVLKEDFSPQTLPSGNESRYDIHLKMETDGEFQIGTAIEIKNTSEDTWQELVFYFIPNIFTQDSSEQLGNTLDASATIQVHDVLVDDKTSGFTLANDTLTIPLDAPVQPGENVAVDFSYQFILPVGGLRFTKTKDNYHLAQFYPMLATYRDHKWNKEEYGFRGETFHTGFSDFHVSYDIPESYTFVSTSEEESYPSQRIGAFHVKDVKEIFIAILKDPLVVEKQVGDVNIRVFGFEEKDDLYKEISEIASDSLQYFQQILGLYPFTQLDIVLDSLGMEYPGIVTAGSIYSKPINDEAVKNMVIHEIAHQWFYGVINNDPYNEAWLDEGFTSFAEEMYHFSKTDDEVPYENMLNRIELIKDSSLPVNLPLDQYENNSHFYGKARTMLWQLFKERGGLEEAEKFLKTYYNIYKYKEVNTEEFVRFARNYFDLEDDSELSTWLEINN